MKRILHLLLIQYTMFCYHNYLSNGKPIIGQNVRQATENEFSFIVSIMVITSGELDVTKDLVCTGTLISSEDILTASHCFNNVHNDNKFLILIGSINLFHGEKFYPCWWIPYDNWALCTNTAKEFQENDIAIIRILGHAPIHILPAILLAMSSTFFYGKNVIIAGWGLSNNNTVAINLQTATTMVISKSDCEIRISNILRTKTTVEKIYMCSIGEPYVLLNYGDSGGPLIYDGNIIAINKGTCPLRKGHLNVQEANAHLNIDYYGNFIADILYN